jgi:serine/threonine-protein kinase
MADLRDQLQTTLGDSLTLEAELGGGGMSRVFVAHEASLGRKVVVKVLPPEMAQAVSIDRFRREIQLAAQLQHPHIVPLLSAGETNGLPFFTMPYVRGESLRARLAKAGELPLSETIRILREVASALAYAHEAGIVHRDIKPENILISGGSAVVTDFGVAKALTASGGTSGSLTSLGVALGTPAYMAPEQATADPNVDHRADIYSLGVVAYEMLTGVTPFTGRSPQSTLAAHVTEAPEPISRRRPTIPPQLALLVMNCLEKHAADRPQSAADVMHELDALNTPTGGMTPTTMLPHAKKSRSVLQMIVVGAAAAALITLAVLGSNKIRKAALQKKDVTPAIAVLPFENVGRKDGQEFADGMTEEITNRLASLHGLRVIGRQSAKSYANSTKTPQEIANELGVNYVLTGTVRWDKAPDGKDLVRVSPALLKSDDATQMWAEAYQTVLSGMFEVQSRVATEVANALNLTLLAPERAALDAKPTDNREAYSLYLRARGIIENTLQNGPIREAISLLEKATAADPKFALGWAYLAVAHTELFWFAGDPTQARLKKARAALDKAMSLDPNIPEAHIARGTYLYHGERNYDEALKEFEAARALRPSDPNVPLYEGAIFRRQGRWNEAVENFKRAVDLDPRSGSNVLDLSTTLIFQGKYSEAEPYVDQGMILAPEEPDGPRQKMMLALAARGNVPEAIEHMRNAVQTVKPHSSLTSLLLQNPWPAIENQSLRSIMLEAKTSPDMSKGLYYTDKADVMLYAGDAPRARAYADSAITALNQEIRNSPEPSASYANLALAQSIRGNKREALDAIARADAALPATVDAFTAADRENTRVMILTNLGDYDAAITQMEKRINVAGGIPRSYLRLHPRFMPMRANPRFQRLIGDR